jgi:hypothetical protein
MPYNLTPFIRLAVRNHLHSSLSQVVIATPLEFTDLSFKLGEEEVKSGGTN